VIRPDADNQLYYGRLPKMLGNLLSIKLISNSFIIQTLKNIISTQSQDNTIYWFSKAI